MLTSFSETQIAAASNCNPFSWQGNSALKKGAVLSIRTCYNNKCCFEALTHETWLMEYFSLKPAQQFLFLHW
jgi:hypothetical protein